MGLLDSVIGSVLGSHGQSGGGSSGTSPMVKALMLLLAAKAANSYMHRGDGAPASTGAGSGGSVAPTPSGSIESGMMAGMPSLDSILGKFRSAGHDDKVESWIGHGPNQPIQPHEVESTLGSETVGQLQSQTGLPKDQLLQQLSQYLPQIIDKLSPNGKLAAPADRAHW